MHTIPPQNHVHSMIIWINFCKVIWTIVYIAYPPTLRRMIDFISLISSLLLSSLLNISKLALITKPFIIPFIVLTFEITIKLGLIRPRLSSIRFLESRVPYQIHPWTLFLSLFKQSLFHLSNQLISPLPL